MIIIHGRGARVNQQKPTSIPLELLKNHLFKFIKILKKKTLKNEFDIYECIYQKIDFFFTYPQKNKFLIYTDHIPAEKYFCGIIILITKTILVIQ